MNNPSPDQFTERERYLMALSALRELGPEEEREWRELAAARPDLNALADQWKMIGGGIASEAVFSSLPEIPEKILHRLDEVRIVHGADSVRSPVHSWLPLAWVGLPVAAILALGFVFLQSRRSHPAGEDSLAMKNAPIAFPAGELVWLAPGKNTSQSRPVFVWRGTPGKIYDLSVETSMGAVLFQADGVQSPISLETMRSVGSSNIDLSPGFYRLTIRQPDGKAAATREFKVKDGATSSDLLATPDHLLRRIDTLAARGEKEDALMLLMRLPEDALSIEAFKEWRKKLE